MKKSVSITMIVVFSVLVISCEQAPNVANRSEQTTVCNPVNLDYRFALDEPSRREAADPTLVNFKDEYYLFASKSGGYWHSDDLIEWDLTTTEDLPLEDYAPTAVVMNDTIYFVASADRPVVYKTGDPKSGKWQVANPEFPIGMIDPCFFVDDDSRLYFYYGCSNINPIYGIELDPKTFNSIGKPKVLFNTRKEQNGWERSGDYNERPENPWIEGAWMTKHNGKYYLQYAVPGTEFKSYCDGVYVSDQPLGDFALALNNPCSSKPEGFVAGAGHSSTFYDKYGNLWHISTMTISQKHMFERRLGLFPMFFDNDGELYIHTTLGDFPFIVPRKRISSPEELFPGWMLLSYNKPVTVSSELSSHPKRYVTDENIRNYWSAETSDQGEWVSVDLEKECTINAVQINYAENNAQIYGRDSDIFYQYLLEYSTDGRTWHILADKTKNKNDEPHDYLELRSPIKTRYIRLTNHHVPSGTFAIAGLRIFGNGGETAPSTVKKLDVARSEVDRCIVSINWEKNADAVGFNILYGTHKDKLYHTYQVLGTDTVTIRSLSSLSKYYFAIEAFNENGTSKISEIIEVD